jgi:diacylglycerol kinase (ATP)
LLIYNPVAGRVRALRAEQMRRVADALSSLGHEVEVAATAAAGSATMLARDAVGAGVDVVFACGGDGTVHEVIQGLVSETREPAAALGILPLGSANALARHLRISFDPVTAAMQQIGAAAKAVPVGKLEFDGQVRYFTVMAGAGPDGMLVYNLLAGDKSNLGRMAYYVHAARLFASRRFSAFEVSYTDVVTGSCVTQRAVSVMAVRVGNLGGLFNKLAVNSAGIEDTHLDLLIVSPPAWLSLPLWFLSGWSNLHGLNRFLRFVKVREFSCKPLAGAAAHFQSDGEWLGRIPMRGAVVEDALRVLIPGGDEKL